MKILLSAYACQPDCGSERGNGWNWSWHLAKMGHEIWVLTHLHGKETKEKALRLNSMPNLHLIYVDLPEKIQHSIKNKNLARFFGDQIYYLCWQHQAYKIAQQLDRKYQFELVHHLTLGSITGGSHLWRLNKPFVFGPVGGGQLAPPQFKKYFRGQWMKEALRSFVNQHLVSFNLNTRRTLNRADLVLVTNQETFNLAKRLGARQIEFFLDTGLPQDYFPQTLPIRKNTSELRLLWVGRLLPRKGLPLILESLTKVNPNTPFKMTVVGAGDLSNCVPNWIKEFGLYDRVEYRGFVPWRELKSLYLDNDVFFFTSLRDSCAPQLLEAMAHGLPIITLDLHGAKRLVPNRAGIKVPVTNPTETANALAQAVEYMHNNFEERLSMSQVGYDFAQTQSWSHKVLKMSECYENFL
jgi:glycosyltransferase involved in cell wall biosynthesis